MEPLQLISIQHELGMAIGLDLRLNDMLDEFTRVCMRRLGLAGVDYYFFYNRDGAITLPDEQQPGLLCHYLSLPRRTGQLEVPPLLQAMSGSDEAVVKSQQTAQGLCYYFRLPGTGFMVLRRLQGRIEPTVVDLLEPIMHRLTVSCRASIQHERLLQLNSALRRAEEKFTFQLYHDDLTQLPNRRGLMQRLKQEVARSKRHGQFGALLFLNLDRFKAVNDSLGHFTGDHLLAQVARMLQSKVREEDTVARLNGDEFVIVLTSLGDDLQQAHNKVDSLETKFNGMFKEPVPVGQHRLQITLSIGVALFPDEDAKAEEILRHADIAMYHAKSAGRNNIVRYTRRMSEEAGRRLALEKALSKALDAGDQFSLHYQPQFSSRNELIGAEALLRWTPPNQAAIPPAAFIPLAEETGQMLELGKWVVGQACRELKTLEMRGLPACFRKLSINVSPVQFEQPGFVADLLQEMGQAGINSRNFGLELTESTLVRHIDDSVDKMLTLERHGVEVSIDDFGKGYSSLSYLNSLPIQSLKVDQAFVRNVDSDRNNRAIVETIMALAHSLEMSLIAEGIESKGELDCLLSLGFQSFQGFLFGRPQPFSEFASLLAGFCQQAGCDPIQVPQ